MESFHISNDLIIQEKNNKFGNIYYACNKNIKLNMKSIGIYFTILAIIASCIGLNFLM
jgi:hypothetical protein